MYSNEDKPINSRFWASRSLSPPPHLRLWRRTRTRASQQKNKNQWRNLGIAGAAVAGYGLLKHNNTATLLGAAGAAYSANRYEQDRHHQSQDNAARQQYYRSHRYHRHYYHHTH